MSALTARQQQIAGLVAKQLSTRSIARATGLSPETVNAHIKQAASRLPGAEKPRGKLTLWFFHLNTSEVGEGV